MKKYFLILFLLFNIMQTFSQGADTTKVLFIGNSYTYVNDLPQMFKNMAASTLDNVIINSNTMGGFTLQLHSSNTTTMNLIGQGNWNYVVLQEQSQLPSFPIQQVETEVFPYAYFLDSTINAGNQCAETVFYMTWGRKNGDSQNCPTWPPVCTYNGMDSLLFLRYRTMADSNNALLSPVGALWHFLRINSPNIELYSADESHPSVAGTYAAACSFYSTILRKDPSLISFNSTLSTSDAAIIRNAAKLIVYDSLSNWNVGKYDPVADFSYSTITGQTISFENLSQYADSFEWLFDDGTSSTEQNPVHAFPASGQYSVTLVATSCKKSDTVNLNINVNISSIGELFKKQWNVCPNPCSDLLTVESSSTYIEIWNYSLFNSEGLVCRKGQLQSNFISQINTNDLKSGIYVLMLNNLNGINMRYKIVKM